MKTKRLPDTGLVEKLNAFLRDPDGINKKPATFPDGSHWKVEIPTVNSVEYLRAIFDSCDHFKIKVHRITETLGLMLHTRADIKEYVELCAERDCQLMMSVGPRAPYDIGRSALTDHGKFAGYRIRGLRQLQYALGEMMYAIDLGVKGFVIYDEGFLDLVANLRAAGDIPQDVCFKASAHMGHGNPASIRLLQRLGADSINPTRDLPVQELMEIRQAVHVPLDIHVDNPASSGGSIRYYDAPTLARELSPVHLKVGNSVLGRHGTLGSEDDARECARRCSVVQEIVRENAADLVSL